MNKIIVSDDRYGDSSFKLYKILPGDYNIGDLVEVQEGGYSRFAVITERKNALANFGDACSTCVFRDYNSRQGIPCGYTTSDGWFPCIAICTRGESIMFKSIDTIMEDL